MSSERLDPQLEAAMKALGWEEFCRKDARKPRRSPDPHSCDKPLNPQDPMVREALHSTVSFSPEESPQRSYAYLVQEKKPNDGLSRDMRKKPNCE